MDRMMVGFSSRSRALSGPRLAIGLLIGAMLSGAMLSGGVAAKEASVSDPARTPGFEAWIRSFEGEARRAGISEQTYRAAFAGITYNDRVHELDQRQPEFASQIWDYLGLLVSEERISKGKVQFQTNYARLVEISERYNVPPQILTAVWGIESNYGTNRGTFRVIEALATLGYEGRRDQWARGQLIDALLILRNGDTTSEQMLGSWAGAMGHTQFIPSSYQSLAVDFDGDGRRDIWSDDPTDALASTANYLAKSGWRPGEPWGFHVALPQNFNYALVQGGRKPMAEWAAMGVRLHSGGDLPAQYDNAELILPAGANGPALLTLNNFRTILRYNNATSYALAVSLLAERIAGQPPRNFVWPEDERALSLTESKDLQGLLTQMGYDTGGIDGRLGRNSRTAIRDFQRSHGLVPDGFPSSKLLEQVRKALAVRDAPISLTPGKPRSPEAQSSAQSPSPADIREMQVLLTGLGFDTDGVDGKAGPRTRSAIGDFVRSSGYQGEGDISLTLLDALRRAARGD